MKIKKSNKKRIFAVMPLSLLVCCVFCVHLYNSFFVPDNVENDWRHRADAVFYRGEAIIASDLVPRSPYDKDKFYREGEFLKYDDDSYNTTIGVDVSTFQDEVDWELVKQAGVDFVIIRAGYRGYTGGGIYEDDLFRTNVENALAAGLDVGVYFYSQAINTAEAVEEADFVLSLIDEYDISYPVVYDWEPVYSSNSRTNDFDNDVLTDCCIAFCDRIKEAGYTPLIYFYKDLAYYHLDLERLIDYGWWLAEYNETPSFYYTYDMIQFTGSGSLPGFSGNVDINLSFYDYSE